MDRPGTGPPDQSAGPALPDLVPDRAVHLAADHPALAADAMAAADRAGDRGAGDPLALHRQRPRSAAGAAVPSVLRAGTVSAAGALPAGAPLERAAGGRPGRGLRARGGVLDGAADDRGLVLPPGQRAGTRRTGLVRAADDPGRLRLLDGAGRLLPVLGAGPSNLVHRTGRGHALRLSAARLRRAGVEVLGLVLARVGAPAPGGDPRHPGRRGGGDGAVHTARPADLPVRGGAEHGMGVPTGNARPSAGSGTDTRLERSPAPEAGAEAARTEERA